MSIPAGYRLVSTDVSRAAEVLHVTSFAFAFTPPVKDADFVTRIYPFEAGRALEVADASRGSVGTLAAAHTSFRFRLAVPGDRAIPTAGLTWVSVHPGHRRRGLLTTMIADHFSRSLERGEPISALYASETEIYQRFGYGLASRSGVIELANGTTFRDIAGSDDLIVEIDSASFDKHAGILRDVQSRMTRPGTIVDFEEVTVAEAFLDLEYEREGAEELRIVVVRDEDKPLAWALLSRKGAWELFGANGKVTVKAWGSVEARATARLMKVLTSFDLMSKAAIGHVPVDDEILHLLANPRGARQAILDNLWVRVLDVKAALEGRGYAADCDVTVDIADAQLPDNAGVWRVAVRDGEATITRVTGNGEADLAMNIQELGAAYLGGTSVSTLASAGLVSERRAGAAGELSRAMASDRAPLCNLDF
ncbi:GNAT family N-acetyltransferase [Demequina sp. NBRC 110057]|uniref:GNAT family N-acetyltransferase n=1 Tax=Demequina sp. NBRC 110057 TaxID=1570346 RepID=UPI000A0524AB|nr:GNAT family N-acetyltransferase [Demequina sp. NBRC 110057]